MAYQYILIDGGTTNTRVGLWLDGKTVETVKIPLGARKSMGGTAALKSEIKKAMNTLCQTWQVAEQNITKILASGMITCEFGLVNLPHISVPAGIEELRASVYETVIPEISSVPITFIRGVKTVGSLSETDMMRGEETELMGLLEYADQNALFVLPGSHSKLIETDENGRIIRFSTTLTGEMIAALSENTILKDAVDLSVDTVDKPHLLEGYTYAKEHGINETLFKVRILKNILGKTPEETYSFFLGAVLQAEIDAIEESCVETVVLGGKKQIRKAMEILLAENGRKQIVSLSEAQVEASVFSGQVRILEGK